MIKNTQLRRLTLSLRNQQASSLHSFLERQSQRVIFTIPLSSNTHSHARQFDRAQYTLPLALPHAAIPAKQQFTTPQRSTPCSSAVESRVFQTAAPHFHHSIPDPNLPKPQRSAPLIVSPGRPLFPLLLARYSRMVTRRIESGRCAGTALITCV